MPFGGLPPYYPDDLKYHEFMMDAAGGGSVGGGGGGGFSGPFIPTFGGQAPGWAGLPQAGEFGGMGGMPMRRRMARPMGGFGPSPGGGGSPLGRPVPPGTGFNPGGGGGYGGSGGGFNPFNPWGGGGPGGMIPRPGATPGGGPPSAGGAGGTPPWAAGSPNAPWNPANAIWNLLTSAGTGGDPNFGGAFGLNPPAAIMEGVRGQAVADAGARERAARLGLQSRGDQDPSTYGFQALQSQLRGQDQTSRAMSEASLGLRQQQLQNYWQLLNALLREGSASDRAQLNPGGGGGFDWAGLVSGLGGLAAGGLPGGLIGYGATR